MNEKTDCTLLIFEDDPNIRVMLQLYFEKQFTKVVTAADGKNASSRVDTTRPDVILLDIVMPHQDGFTILEHLRAEGNETPIIILTDKNRVDDKVRGLELGADDYQTKPFSLRELHARITAQLRRVSNRRTHHDQAALDLGPLQIDPQGREVTHQDGSAIRLTKTEFDLLAYLAARQGSVISHGELLQEVLGYDPQIETKALVMHIANLRKKLEQAVPESILITAVAGVGYKIHSANRSVTG